MQSQGAYGGRFIPRSREGAGGDLSQRLRRPRPLYERPHHHHHLSPTPSPSPSPSSRPLNSPSPPPKIPLDRPRRPHPPPLPPPLHAPTTKKRSTRPRNLHLQIPRIHAAMERRHVRALGSATVLVSLSYLLARAVSGGCVGWEEVESGEC